MNRTDDNERQRAALAELEKLRRPNTLFGTSFSAGRAQVKRYFDGEEASPQSDPAEIWGRRLGRALSLIGVVALGLYLVAMFWR